MVWTMCIPQKLDIVMTHLSIVTKQKHTTQTNTTQVRNQFWNCEVPVFIHSIAKKSNLSKNQLDCQIDYLLVCTGQLKCCIRVDWPHCSTNPDWCTDSWLYKQRWFCSHIVFRLDCWNITFILLLMKYPSTLSMTRFKKTDVSEVTHRLHCWTKVVFRGEAAPISSSASVPISPQLFNPCQQKEPKSDTRVLGLDSQLFSV